MLNEISINNLIKMLSSIENIVVEKLGHDEVRLNKDELNSQFDCDKEIVSSWTVDLNKMELRIFINDEQLSRLRWNSRNSLEYFKEYREYCKNNDIDICAYCPCGLCCDHITRFANNKNIKLNFTDDECYEMWKIWKED